LKSTPTYKAESGINLFFNPGSTIKKSVKADFSYELSYHISTSLNINLGNALAVITDWKIKNTDGTFSPELISSQDYYPFGLEMPDRGKHSTDIYKYSFNGKEVNIQTNSTKSETEGIVGNLYLMLPVQSSAQTIKENTGEDSSTGN